MRWTAQQCTVPVFELFCTRNDKTHIYVAEDTLLTSVEAECCFRWTYGKAFDVMPRDRLREALQLAQIHPAAQYVILQLHAHASIRIAHGHCRATLDTTNGIRQGCCLAPALWVLYTGLIMTYLKTQLSMHDTTVYADDFLFHWMVNSCEQLEGAFHNIAFVLRTLDRFGMRPSPSKSAVMIGVRGTRIGSLLSKHV